MTIPKRREPERPVDPGVLVVANANEGQFEESDHQPENLIPRQASPPQIGLDSLAVERQ